MSFIVIEKRTYFFFFHLYTNLFGHFLPKKFKKPISLSILILKITSFNNSACTLQLILAILKPADLRYSAWFWVYVEKEIHFQEVDSVYLVITLIKILQCAAHRFNIFFKYWTFPASLKIGKLWKQIYFVCQKLLQYAENNWKVMCRLQFSPKFYLI